MKSLVRSNVDTSTSSLESDSSSEEDSSSPESSRRNNKFWNNKRGKRSVTTTRVVTAAEYSDDDDGIEFGGDMLKDTSSLLYSSSREPSSSSSSRQQQQRENNGNHDEFKVAPNNNNTPQSSQRRQTKVLLVSLIESLCKTYGGSPETTRKMFIHICQTLRNLGFIDSEFHDDVASIRFTYHKAFEHIFYAAAQSVLKTELPAGNNQLKLLTSSTEQQQEFINQHIDSSELTPLKYSLNHIQNSRYQNDFIEVSKLGRGGFASAWKVRNKLDDVEYAIKKIRLGGDEDNEDDDNYDHDKILREIKNLARLEHHNVVRYYSSWLEYANEIEEDNDDDYDQSEGEELSWLSSSSLNNDDESSIFNGHDPTFEISEDSLSFNNNKLTADNEDVSFISFGHDNNCSPSDDNGENLYLQTSSSTSTIRKSSSSNNFNRKKRRSKKTRDTSGGFILYIQMQLCPSTLHEYLKYRNQNTNVYFDEQQNIDLFVQILEGAAYIHQEGLIHRDLKPSNIFLSSRPATTTANNLLDYRSRHYSSSSAEVMVPKIGDFGLAASVLPVLGSNDEEEDDDLYTGRLSSQHSSSHSSSVIELFTTAASMSSASSSSFANKSSSIDSEVQFLTARRRKSNSSRTYQQGRSRSDLRRNITSGVGTRTYAAPEQLAIPSLPYDEKADIYSLGIILFELYFPFSTAMERADTIENLKKGIFPDSFIETFPTQAEIIRSMMNPDPCLRPTALELLDLELFKPPYNNKIVVVEQPTNITLTSAAEEVHLLHDREMAEMRHQYNEMKHANEDLQRRLDELQSKLDVCQLRDQQQQVEEEEQHHKKRHHTLEEDEECSAQHESKKKELDNHTSSSMISKILFSSSSPQ